MSTTAIRDEQLQTLEPSSGADAERKRERRRWIALGVLCLGQLMMVLDATIVNVALPAIQRELHFTQANLTWVIDGYLITFGGFLLLAGRFGDLVGRKKVFLSGLVLFVSASILCGLADSQAVLIGARLIQGVGGAIASSVILAIIVTEFPEKVEQAKAMGLYAFVSAGGGSIGLLAGGALTQSLSWHWIFFVNVPIGAVALVLGWILIEENKGIGLSGGVDFATGHFTHSFRGGYEKFHNLIVDDTVGNTAITAKVAAVLVEAEGPWPRIDRRIVEGCLVLEVVGVGEDELLHVVDVIAGEVSGPAEPPLGVVARGVNHQGCALPVTARVTHP